MIRKFEKLDFFRIKENDFCLKEDFKIIVENDDFKKHTVIDKNGIPVCIISFYNYWEKNWIGSLFISKEIKPIHAREIRDFIKNAFIDLCAERLQTDSVDCDILNRWHRFIGFEFEGTRKKMFRGKDYNMWSIMKWE